MAMPDGGSVLSVCSNDIEVEFVRVVGGSRLGVSTILYVTADRRRFGVRQ